MAMESDRCPASLSDVLQLRLRQQASGVHLSDVVQDAQIKTLLGYRPAPLNKAARDRAKPSPETDRFLRQIARLYDEFAPDKTFDVWYDHPYFLACYHTYYFPQYVCAVKIMLTRLFLQRRLPPRLNVVDIGVGTGTTTIAILDFFRDVALECALYGFEFPFTALSITGVDARLSMLRYAQRAESDYSEALVAHREAEPFRWSEAGHLDTIDRICDWAERSFQPLCSNVAQGQVAFTLAPNLLVLGNVLNEVADTRGRFPPLDHIVDLVRVGGTLMVHEHGKRGEQLARWQHCKLAGSHYSHRFPNSEPNRLRPRWTPLSTVRVDKYPLHLSPLLREFFSRSTRRRQYAVFPNDLLYWSNSVLQRTV